MGSDWGAEVEVTGGCCCWGAGGGGAWGGGCCLDGAALELEVGIELEGWAPEVAEEEEEEEDVEDAEGGVRGVLEDDAELAEE